MKKHELIDGKWYLIKYNGITEYICPAIYRQANKTFCSIQFAGIPVEELDVIREIDMSNEQKNPLAAVRFIQEAAEAVGLNSELLRSRPT